jgi:cytochrome c
MPVNSLKQAVLTRAVVAVLVLAAHPTLALAAEDVVAGQKTFAVRCASCHGTTAGEKRLGPTLAGVFGHESGDVAGFRYSPALKNAHLTWDATALDKWLQNPSSLVRGTTMFVNVPSSADRQNLIAYLKTLSPDARASSATTP